MTIYEIIANPQYKQKSILKRIIMHHTWYWSEDIIINYDTTLSPSISQDIFNDYINFSEKNKPIEYILWYCRFLERDFIVTPATLIPRAETEYMITSVRDRIITMLDEKKIFSDIILYDTGTWSGILGISVSLEITESEISKKAIIMTDIDQACLDVAQQNIARHIPADDQWLYTLFVSDLLSFLWEKNDQWVWWEQTHIFVANLPYIPDQSFYESDELSVREREPHIAFVWGDDGLDLYRRYIGQWDMRRQSRQSVIFCEMMTRQAELLAKQFPHLKQTVCRTFHANIIILMISW